MNGQSFLRRPGPTKGCRANDDDEVAIVTSLSNAAGLLESSWNVMAHGDAREGKWRGNRRMEWVASTLHTISEHGASSITTADAHTSADSSRLKWSPCRCKWTRLFRRKTKSGFFACAITFQLASTNSRKIYQSRCQANNSITCHNVTLCIYFLSCLPFGASLLHIYSPGTDLYGSMYVFWKSWVQTSTRPEKRPDAKWHCERLTPCRVPDKCYVFRTSLWTKCSSGY